MFIYINMKFFLTYIQTLSIYQSICFGGVFTYSYFEHLNIVKCVNTTGFETTSDKLGELGGEGVFKHCLGKGNTVWCVAE